MPIAEPLSRSWSHLQVANAALAELGVRSIENFEENSHAARTINLLYGDTLSHAIGSYPWRFARVFEEMHVDPNPADPPYTTAFQIDPLWLQIQSVWENDTKIRWDRIGNRIQCKNVYDPANLPVFRAEVTRIPEPEKWPDYFRRSFVIVLAGAIAMPMLQDANFSAGKKQEGELMMRQARSRDSQGRTPPKVQTQHFIWQRRARRRTM